VIRGGGGDDDLDAGEGIADGIGQGLRRGGDDTLRGGDYTDRDRYVLDGGANTEVGDNMPPGHPRHR
jgi:hypothetical protein